MLILLLYLTYEKTLNVLWKSFMYSSLIFSQYDIFFLIHGHCLLHLILVWHSPYEYSKSNLPTIALEFILTNQSINQWSLSSSLSLWLESMGLHHFFFFFYRQVVIGRQKLLYLIKSISICWSLTCRSCCCKFNFWLLQG